MSTTVGPSPDVKSEPDESGLGIPQPAEAGRVGRAGRAGRAGRKGGRGGRRRTDRWKTAFFLLTAVALVGGVTWALLGSSLFVVRSVHVYDSGNSSMALPGFAAMPVPRNQIRVATGIKIGMPLIRVETAQVRRRVAAITAVQSVTVRRSWPDAVVISVVPRTAVFTVRVSQGFDVVDSYGVVLGQDAHRPAGLLPLKAPADPAQMRRSRAVQAAGAVVRRLPSWLRDIVGEVRAVRAGRVILVLRGGTTVVWGGPDRAVAKAKETAILLRTNARYFDVSDPHEATAGRGR
ncbi:MAG TPA: FtsQ-type POTRA domain-containing protein [Streptosporangiaceae bacterium]|nr:FtsQ-type POTRA domain-containing protein [Streptosporangiaceae bacterium]